MFEIRKADIVRSCNHCGAANYDFMHTKKATEIIYEIKIGCMCNALCPDCMKALADQITAELETAIEPERIPDRKCPHCHGTVHRSQIDGYYAQCFDCDEDFYEFELERSAP